MDHLHVSNFGPIRDADVTFGDLTVLVGPQASGKSLFVQLVKAVKDAGAIRGDLKSYGFDWLHGTDLVSDWCGLYFGGGLQGIVSGSTKLLVNGKERAFSGIAKPGPKARADETVFLIPAQRVLVLQDGWPKPFMAYSAGDPYCMRRFSDSLRLLMEQGLGSGDAIFPQPKRLKAELRSLLDDAIYVGAKLKLETDGLRRRVVLAPHEGALPFSAWSAGQREFTPLLLGLYWLMPPGQAPRRGALNLVVVEEPEMGLHPQAIVSFGLLVLELLSRDYRVVVSTHSPVMLDLVWAIQQLKEVARPVALKVLQAVFGLPRLSTQIQKVLTSALEKSYRTYAFERGPSGVAVRDISQLDPGSDDPLISGWGGLSGYSGRIAELVGEALAEEAAE
jgi:AAA domain, putative AbiEii toxin, Type IV TA system